MQRQLPSVGDVLIAPDPTGRTGFTLSIAPDGAPQLWYASYQVALNKALAWAASTGVSVWRLDGDKKFVGVSATAHSSVVPERLDDTP
jgi:hypothetical protein